MMKGVSEIERITQKLKDSKKIVIAGHLNPDGDSIGSCFALAYALKCLGKEPMVFLEEYSPKFNCIPGKEFLFKGELKEACCDVFVSVDCATPERMGKPIKLFKHAPFRICIDHHIAEKLYGDLNLVVEGASSTGELMYDIIDSLLGQESMNEEICTCIYAALINDTGGFRHSCTSRKTMQIAGVLMEKIRFTEIYNELCFRRSPSEAKILARSIEKIKTYGNVATAILTQKDYEDCQANSKDLDGIAEYILGIRGMEVSILGYVKKEKDIKFSLRSKSINVAQIAKKYGGGGHALAAGCNQQGDLHAMMEFVLKDVLEALKEATKDPWREPC